MIEAQRWMCVMRRPDQDIRGVQVLYIHDSRPPEVLRNSGVSDICSCMVCKGVLALAPTSAHPRPAPQPQHLAWTRQHAAQDQKGNQNAN